jgi:UPF0755 protein
MKRWPVAAAALLVLAGAGTITLRAAIDRPFLRDTTLLTIPEGTTATGVRRLLQHEGPVDRPLWELLIRANGWARRLGAGTYRLGAGETLRSVLDSIAHGRTLCMMVTVPEGSDLRRIGELMETAGIAPASTIAAAARVGAVPATIDGKAVALEGYLFPDTYCFAPGSPAEVVTGTMMGRLREVWEAIEKPSSIPGGFDLHGVLTLASIVEKETGYPAERPLIAAVFLNRLRIGMPLQSDPTVIYSLPSFDGNIRKQDLSVDSPFNTYRHRGLPPGPIASPGRAAIEAVLRPAAVDYLYFVARGDGTHQFSKTLAEHNRAVSRYQLRRAKDH